MYFPNLWTTFFCLSCSSSVLGKLNLTVTSLEFCIISRFPLTFNAYLCNRDVLYVLRANREFQTDEHSQLEMTGRM